MDPAHIAPSRSDTNSNGHFPLNSHGQSGTPRGFNLSNLQQFNLPTIPGGLPNAMQMAAFLAQSGMNPQWSGNHAAFGGAEEDRHNTGPMRRNNNGSNSRFNNRPAGPYDRPNKDNRTARWNAPGRLTQKSRIESLEWRLKSSQQTTATLTERLEAAHERLRVLETQEAEVQATISCKLVDIIAPT